MNEMTEGRKAGWATKIEPGPFLSSKSGSTTAKDGNFSMRSTGFSPDCLLR